SSGDIDIVRYLIDQKADIDKTDGGGWSPLHIAGELSASRLIDSIDWILASAGHEDVVQDLIGAGADVNKRNDKGITPL
ncbi:hypothetical protein C8J56DRAFT_783512, partial [Mycena floridula]